MNNNQNKGQKTPFKIGIVSYTILFATLGALFPIIAFFAETKLGSPSSTSGLIIIMIIPFGIIGGIAGLLYGGLVKLSTKGKNGGTRRAWKIFIRTGLVMLTLVIIVPVGLTQHWQNVNRPRIILCADSVKDIPKEKIDSEANRLLSAQKINPDNIEDYNLWLEKDVLHVKNLTTGIENSYDYSKFEYIRSLNYSMFGDEKYLAVMLVLRATSHKCMFVLFDNSGNCIYQELRIR